MAYHTYDYEAKPYIPRKLATNRKMWKLMLLSPLTLGIYGIVFFMPLSFDLDKIAPRRDGSQTMNFLFAYVLSFFTLNIVLTYWHYQIAARIEEALSRRRIPYEFKTSDFWLWYFFGSLVLVGPFVYFHKLCKAMNLLCADYNENPTME